MGGNSSSSQTKSQSTAQSSEPPKQQLFNWETLCQWGQYDCELGKEKLGQGGFGEVWKVCKKRQSDDQNQLLQEVAVKIVELKKFLAQGVCMQDLIKDYSSLILFNHKNIVKLLDGPFEFADKFVIEIEYADGGDLDRFLRRQRTALSDELLENWSRQIIEALAILHGSGLIHRDISAMNVLLSTDASAAGGLVPKLADFGLTRNDVMTEEETVRYFASSSSANYPYAPPEFIIKSEQRSKDSDIWSLGVVFYYMLYLKLPFTSAATGELYKVEIGHQIETYDADCNQRSKNTFPELAEAESDYRKRYRLLVMEMMKPNRRERPSDAQHLLEHELFITGGHQALRMVEFATQDSRQIQLHNEIFDQIAYRSPLTSQLPAVFLSISGKSRQGKSLLFSLFLQFLQIRQNESDLDKVAKRLRELNAPLDNFKSLAGSGSCTNGIDIWSRPFAIDVKQSDGSVQRRAFYLLDTEGTKGLLKDGTQALPSGDIQKEIMERDYVNLVVTAIISSLQLYNVRGIPGNDDVGAIRDFSNYLLLLARRSDGLIPERRLMQMLIFLIRDFVGDPEVTDLAERFGFEAAKEVMNESSSNFKPLEEFFELVTFYPLPKPGDIVASEKPRRGVRPFTVCDLKKAFLTVAVSFFDWIVNNAQPLARGQNSAMNLKQIQELLAVVVQDINEKLRQGKGQLELKPLCESMATVEHNRAIVKVFEKYYANFVEEIIKEMERLMESDEQNAMFGESENVIDCLSEKCLSDIYRFQSELALDMLRNDTSIPMKVELLESYSVPELNRRMKEAYDAWVDYFEKRRQHELKYKYTGYCEKYFNEFSPTNWIMGVHSDINDRIESRGLMGTAGKVGAQLLLVPYVASCFVESPLVLVTFLASLGSLYRHKFGKIIAPSPPPKTVGDNN